tara:strand:- start:478711 stop:478839 length:129 start_codon:yes stop_codon:yes gene_type:complete
MAKRDHCNNEIDGKSSDYKSQNTNYNSQNYDQKIASQPDAII